MDEIQALQQQLEEARDEAELNLLQLQQVQEELEFYFLRCQQLDQQLADQQQGAAEPSPELEAKLDQTQARLEELKRQRQEEQRLLGTAQTMLEGQARYLEDVSRREEEAAQALDRLRLLEGEILYYLRHSKPLPTLDPQQISRLINLVKEPKPVGG